eukprot:194319-Pleurochrysis_carterae.AAC.1
MIIIIENCCRVSIDGRPSRSVLHATFEISKSTAAYFVMLTAFTVKLSVPSDLQYYRMHVWLLCSDVAAVARSLAKQADLYWASSNFKRVRPA